MGTEPTPEGIALGRELTAQVKAKTEELLTSALLIEDEPALTKAERDAFDIGVDFGLSATMLVLQDRGMIVAPR